MPGIWLKAGNYVVYGQEQTSWAKMNAYRDADEMWYVRDVAVPAAKDSKAYIRLAGMRRMGVRAYWNGEPVGVVTNQQVGRVELPSSAIGTRGS